MPGPRLRRYLRTLANTPPNAWSKLVRRKLAGGNVRPTGAELAANPKHRPQRPYDFLSRYEAILGREIGWQPLDFTDATVLELGCGPVFGWAPLAIFRGAKRYLCVDPEVDPAVLRDPVFAETYLLAVFRDLSAIYGPRGSFEAFLNDLQTGIECYDAELLQADIAGPVHVMLSNSCLEHVNPLDGTARRLHELMAQDGRFLHLVDFGNHRSSARPFADIYTHEPDDYRRLHGRGINLLRGSEMLEIFAEAGFDAALVPYYRIEPDEPAQGRWREFSADDLSLKAGLLVGPRPQATST